MQHSEGFVTAVVEAVASGIVNTAHLNHPDHVQPWSRHDVLQKQQIKESILDVVLRTLDAAKEIRGPVHVAQSWLLYDDEVAEHLIAKPLDSDGRSDWYWLTTADGELMLGIYPQGGTYELLSQGPAAVDYETALAAGNVSSHTIALED